MARTNTRDKPVLFIHGRNADDMGSWSDLKDLLVGAGYARENISRVGYYGGECNVELRAQFYGSHAVHRGGAGEHLSERGCASPHGGYYFDVHDVGTSIRHLGYHLAWMIWDQFTSRGIAVDVVGHSMGGLLIRYAIHMSDRDETFPPHLFVEDIVTYGTPHDGVRLAACWWPDEDIQMMCWNSSFMKEMKRDARNPQSGWETDWTVIGSKCDEAVRAPEATGGIDAAHKIFYVDYSTGCVRHNSYHTDVSQSWDADVCIKGSPNGQWNCWPGYPHAGEWLKTALLYRDGTLA